MENIIVGVLLSVSVSLATPIIKRRIDVTEKEVKMGLIVGASLILAILQKIYGDSFLQSFVEIIGTATVYYQYLNKPAGKPVETYIESKF